MKPDDLKIGQVYFVLGYEDEDFEFPIIQSFEYIEVVADKPPPLHLFRLIGGDAHLELMDEQVQNIVIDANALAIELRRWKSDRE